MNLSEFAKNNPKKQYPATQRMREFAIKIAYALNLSEPDFSSFEETKQFIDDNIDDYNNIDMTDFLPF